jgi:Na+/H+ antiporter NhaD/arsenite permease-like protein
VPKQYTADYALDWTCTKRQHCSTATITGNLQSIVIGNLSGIGFVPFLQARRILSLLIAWAIVAIVY